MAWGEQQSGMVLRDDFVVNQHSTDLWISNKACSEAGPELQPGPGGGLGLTFVKTSDLDF